MVDPARMTIIIGGNLGGIDVVGLLEPLFGAVAHDSHAGPCPDVVAAAAVDRPIVRLYHPPGAVRSRCGSVTWGCRGASPISTPSAS